MHQICLTGRSFRYLRDQEKVCVCVCVHLRMASSFMLRHKLEHKWHITQPPDFLLGSLRPVINPFNNLHQLLDLDLWNCMNPVSPSPIHTVNP